MAHAILVHCTCCGREVVGVMTRAGLEIKSRVHGRSHKLVVTPEQFRTLLGCLKQEAGEPPAPAEARQP